MHLEELKQRLRQEPFRPFTIRLNNGNEYEVKDPDRVGGNDYVLHWFEPSPSAMWVSIAIPAITELINGGNGE